MSRYTRFIVAALLGLVFATATVPAYAAPSQWENVSVTLHTEDGQPMLLVSGELPDSVKLPYEAELAVPTGAELNWIGEILGGPVAEDPELKYTKTTANGMDVYRFTLTKAHTAQFEGVMPGITGSDGADSATALKWTAWQALPEVRISQRLPRGAKIIKPSAGAALEDGDSTSSYYTKTVTGVKAGDEVDLAFTYTAPLAGVPGAAGTAVASAPASSGTDLLIQVLLVAVVVLIGAAAFVAIRRKLAEKSAAAEEGPNSSRSRASGTKSSNAAPAEPVARGLSGPAKVGIVVAGLLAIAAVVAIFLGMDASKPAVTGDTISQTFSQGDPCATADIALVVSPGADPSATAEKLFAALKPVPSLTTVTYNPKTSSIQIGYCESETNEDVLRSTLAQAGFAPQGAPASAPGTATAPGTQGAPAP